MNGFQQHSCRIRASTSLLGAALLGLAMQISAGCAVRSPAAPLLNSERIAQRFGSYGVQVLYQDEGLRVSNLHSVHQGRRICRTFAVVEFASPVAVQLAAEHRLIRAGESLGAVFKAQGWEIEKHTLFVGEITPAPALGYLQRWMGDTGAAPLAVHVYAFAVRRAGSALDYARITEVHHPDYLRRADLRATLAAGGLPSSDQRGGIEETLEDAGERLEARQPEPLFDLQ